MRRRRLAGLKRFNHGGTEDTEEGDEQSTAKELSGERGTDRLTSLFCHFVVKLTLGPIE